MENRSKKIKIEIEPIGKRIMLDKPENGLKAIVDSGIGLKSVCGGKGTCGKCRILVLEDRLKPPVERELQALSTDEISHGIRLACQQTFDRNLNIYIPASSLTEEQKLQVTGAEAKIAVMPVCRKYHIKLQAPTLSDMESDFARIKNTLEMEYKIKVSGIDFNVLKSMPLVLRNSSWEITATVRGHEIVMIEAGNKTGSSYGIAVDLGTTKIAVLLVDLNSGETIAKKGVMNPQISFGEDVMSRINFAMQSSENLEKIQKIVVEQINRTVEELACQAGISREEIIEFTIVGNTAMHHLFLGLPVKQLGLSPFVALTDKPLEIKARDLGISISPGAYIYLVPVIAGFVGSDHIAMILASGIEDMDENVLGIDIGTNTEIVLKSKKGLESVSTASGPAFEGAHIKYGMRAAPGAIERVVIDPESCLPKIQTINDKKPIGICGSGILDAVAELLKAEIINNRGKFQPQSGCLCVDSKGNLQYLLEPEAYEDVECIKNENRQTEPGLKAANSGAESGILKVKLKASDKPGACPCVDEVISINQKDIVEIQLAKSAIRTGIDILLESAKMDFSELGRIIIAGAFGSYIDPKNVVDIGMFPKVSLKKIFQVGNAAAVGAKMVLVSELLRKKAEKIAEKGKYLELTVFPTFSDHFAKSTLFPEPAKEA